MRLPHASPASGLKNPQAPGRAVIIFAAEVLTLIRKADADGYHGLAIMMRIMWDTLFSPIDVWTLTPSQLKPHGKGGYVERRRTKTQAAAYGWLPPETWAALRADTAGLPFELPPDTPFIRQRNGQAYRSKDTVGDDFRAVRSAHLPADRQVVQLIDFRRSGNVEADVARADKSTMGEILANGLASSAFLDATYTPPTVTKAKEVAELRAQGRRKLASEYGRLRGATGSKEGR